MSTESLRLLKSEIIDRSGLWSGDSACLIYDCAIFGNLSQSYEMEISLSGVVVAVHTVSVEDSSEVF